MSLRYKYWSSHSHIAYTECCYPRMSQRFFAGRYHVEWSHLLLYTAGPGMLEAHTNRPFCEKWPVNPLHRRRLLRSISSCNFLVRAFLENVNNTFGAKLNLESNVLFTFSSNTLNKMLLRKMWNKKLGRGPSWTDRPSFQLLIQSFSRKSETYKTFYNACEW
jgi:hypothetical protein